MLYKAVQVLKAESHIFITTKKSLKEKMIQNLFMNNVVIGLT